MKSSRKLATLLAWLATASAGCRARSADEPVLPPACSLEPGKNAQPNEGITDYALYLRPAGTLRAIMIFVDFPDAPGAESTRDLHDLLVPYAAEWFEEASYGRMKLAVEPLHEWLRMPRPSSAYGIARNMSFEKHRAYISDAVSISEGRVVHEKYRILYAVASREADLPASPAFTACPGTGVEAKGHEIRLAATFGKDIRVPRPHYGAHVLIHETGHILGLPDLYDWKSPTLREAIRAVGGWDIMSFNTPGAQFLAWHKWKLGWLDGSQVRVHRSGTLTETLAPLEGRGGLKAIIIPTSPSTAVIVEARRPAQAGPKDEKQTHRLVKEGVLIYTVDATVPNGSMPARVLPAKNGVDPRLLDRCGPLYDAPYDAPFGAGVGGVSSFSDPKSGVSLEVLETSAEGYRVRLTRR